jgi:hypothetical protein
MKPTKVLGLLLLGLGTVALAYQGFSYTTTEKVVDLGPIHVTNEETHKLPISPILAVIGLIGGIGLLVFAGKKT